MGIPFSRFLQDQRVIRHPQNPRHPFVSVVMPTYILRPGGMNQRAIESVLSQSFTNFEFIIIDDGSIDGLQEILLEYQRRDARIVLIRHEVNSGLPAVRVNEGLLLATGKYIAYQFEDDEWLPDCLERLLETLHEGPENCLVYGAVDWTIHRPNGSVERRRLGEWDFNYALLKNSNKIANCAVLHPRDVFEVCGLYDPHILIRRACDYDLWLRMAKKILFRRCPHVVAKVVSGTKHALGVMVEQDVVVTFRYVSTERDHRLTPSVIGSYEVDSLPFCRDMVEANRLREHYIIPFFAQRPALLTPPERRLVLATRAYPNRLCVTKGDYSTSVDVTLGNFSRALQSPDFHSFAYLQEHNLKAATERNYDTLLLYRTVGTQSLEVLRTAQMQGKAVIYLMDDNMFQFGAGYLADEFAYLKPESPGYRTLEKEVSAADLVLSYMPRITEDCLARNPRVVELRTNIQENYIQNVEPLAGGKESGRRLKYAILSGSARRKEFSTLGGQFREFARRHSGAIEFHIWGVDPAEFGDSLACPTFYRPFNHCYEAYLQALGEERFDFVIIPLFDDHEAKKSKSPIKYLEATAAGAVGIYSDATAYQVVQHGETGLKASGETGAWLEALEYSFQIEDEERRKLHQAAKQHILNEFTTEAQVLTYLTAFEVADLHASLASRSSQDGRATIAYFFHESLLGGATLHLLQHARILRHYKFKPLLCFPAKSPLEPAVQQFASRYECQTVQLDFLSTIWKRDPTKDDYLRAEKLEAWLRAHDVRFVHMVTYMADVALAAQGAGLPLVATLHQYYDLPPVSSGAGEDTMPPPRRLVSAVHSSSLCYAEKWQEVLEAPALCIRAPVVESYFKNFEKRQSRQKFSLPTLLIAGTLQPRKGQLKAIQAVKALGDRGIPVRLVLLGYNDLVPEYVSECRRTIQVLGLTERVRIVPFAQNPQEFYDAADYLLCASDDESMPQSILQAMASGIGVISTPVGGVKELIRDGFSGVVADGTEAADLATAIKRALVIPERRWQQMVKNARDTACMVCSEEVVAYQLLKLYNLACHEYTVTTLLERRREARARSDAKAAATHLPQLLSEGEADLAVANGEIVRQVGDPPLGYEPLIGALRYRLTPQRPRWKAVRIFICTPLVEVKGRLTFRVLLENGAVVRKGEVSFVAGNNADWVELEFPEIQHADGQSFILELSLRAPRTTQIGLFETQHTRSRLRRAARLIGVSPIRNNLFSRLIYGR